KVENDKSFCDVRQTVHVQRAQQPCIAQGCFHVCDFELAYTSIENTFQVYGLPDLFSSRRKQFQVFRVNCGVVEGCIYPHFVDKVLQVELTIVCEDYRVRNGAFPGMKIHTEKFHG